MYSIHHVLLQLQEITRTGFVMSAGVLVLLMAVFITGLALVSRRKKNLLVTENSLLKQEFERELLFNRIEVQEATFDSMGKELHDNVGQLLSTAKMLIGISERSIPQPPLALLAANEALNKAIEEIRSISKSLNQEWLQQFNLYRNIESEAERFRSAEFKIMLNLEEPLSLEAEEQFILFRILQEGLHNVIKHAEAMNVWLKIFQTKSCIKAILQDDGKGFDTNQKETGLGLNNMKQRTKSMGGTIDWKSSSAGTIINILIPIKHFNHETHYRNSR